MERSDGQGRGKSRKEEKREEGKILNETNLSPPPPRSKDKVIDKMIPVMELLEKKMKELEDRLETAEVKIIQLAASKPCKVNDRVVDRTGSGKKKEVSKGSVGGRYRYKADRTLLMFRIIGLAVTAQASSAMCLLTMSHITTLRHQRLQTGPSMFIRARCRLRTRSMKRAREFPMKSEDPEGAHWVPGKHAVVIFLLCGVLLTAGWGSIMALLTVALRVCMRKQPHKVPQSTPLRM